MSYTIKQVSEMIGLSIPTLRYYDKEGLLPNLQRRESGYRVFTDDDLETIRVIECFKQSGLQIKEMKHFMQLVQQGDSTLQECHDIYQNQVKRLEEKIAVLQEALDVSKIKLSYYEEALAAGTETEILKQYREKWSGKASCVGDK
ncbi:MerR family transcriptional regulator [Aminipila luticellarii]|uniref:MerR family transcriptional regulator n=1 Tax=Aminipila luticellarii TaxID=2507160 RepID=A0A410PX92_9FIRM|nr:MerR family transcriptional regulator [Aminipila luticellarii]QAT43563.1 MerR family transcriptional regulator [Aminipila luticellarii]